MSNLLPYLENDYHIFILDLRGHGKSDKANIYPLGEMADDVKSFIQNIIKEPTNIHGHSLGGIIVLRLLNEIPNLIKSVTIGDMLYD